MQFDYRLEFYIARCCENFQYNGSEVFLGLQFNVFNFWLANERLENLNFACLEEETQKTECLASVFRNDMKGMLDWPKLNSERRWMSVF